MTVRHRPSRGKSLRSGGVLGGRRRWRARDGVETRARRMVGMNGPRQTAGNAQVVAARRARTPAATQGLARGLAVRRRGYACGIPAALRTMTQFWCCPFREDSVASVAGSCTAKASGGNTIIIIIIIICTVVIGAKLAVVTVEWV
jgi:hypothetical protein